MHANRVVLAATKPIGIAWVGHDKIEGAICGGIEIRQCARRRSGLGVVKRLQNQLAATALAGQGPEAVVTIHDRGDQSVIVDPEPTSTRLQIESGHHVRAVGPVSPRRAARPRLHLVAIGGDQNRPSMTRTTQNDEGTQRLSLQVRREITRAAPMRGVI